MSNRQLVDEIVSRMNKFASNVKSDKVSVQVARLAQKLNESDSDIANQLTAQELRVISMFTNRNAA